MPDIPAHISVKSFLQQETITATAAALDEVPAEEIVAALQERYGPVLKPDETMPNLAFLVELDRRAMGRLASLPGRSDQQRRLKVVERRDAFRRRKMAGDQLGRDLWALAVKIQSHYGRSALSYLGLAGSRSRNAGKILDQARHVLALLRADEVTLPEYPLEEREALEPAALADELELSILQFESSIGATPAKTAGATTALSTKRSGLRRAAFGRRAIIERYRLMLRFAGRDELAERLNVAEFRTQAALPSDDPPSDDPPSDDPSAG